MKCKNCKWWDSTDETVCPRCGTTLTGFGLCRKDAPSERYGSRCFPSTEEDDWCGKFNG